jgi:hypothetical protein
MLHVQRPVPDQVEQDARQTGGNDRKHEVLMARWERGAPTSA